MPNAAEKTELLTRLPLLFNSSLETKQVVDTAIRHLTASLAAEAGTVFLKDHRSGDLVFWSLHGGSDELSGQRLGEGKGIVGWVIERQEAVRVNDVAKDKRFLHTVDESSSFKTRNLVCAPLMSKGLELGAIQILNAKDSEGFSEEDLAFLTKAANQLSLALDNARLYETLSQKNKKLQALAKKKDQIMGIIAHEFRTPLMLVQSSADLLASDILQDEESQQKIAETLKRGTERVIKLLTNIQSMGMLTDRKLPVNIAPFDVREMLEDIIESRRDAAVGRKLFLHLDIDPDVTDALGDVTMIAIVVTNLLDNAIRFTPDEGKINVSAKLFAGEVEFSVRDTGIGISEDNIPAIFDSFFEVTDVMNHQSGTFEFKSAGLGLGLATVSAILDAHDTEVQVVSELEAGSAFSFRLPV